MNCDITQQECLAVIWIVLLLCPYVESSRFVVRTVHQAFRWILHFKESTGRLASWRLRLMEFDFKVQHGPGRRNMVADILSGLQSDHMFESYLDEVVQERSVE